MTKIVFLRFERCSGALAGNQLEGGATSAKHGVGPTSGTNGF